MKLKPAGLWLSLIIIVSGVQVQAEPELISANTVKSSISQKKSAKSTKKTKAETTTSKAVPPGDPALRAKVLSPDRFYGLASMGYAAAQTCPEVMQKLFCYCGCDITDNHSSLLDCFTSIHGVDCHICQEEAVMALKLHRDGVPVEQIQKQVDERYSREYPFEEDTAIYKKYKASRNGSKTTDTEAAKNTPTSAGTDISEESKKPPKTKSGKAFKPSCCSGAEHKQEK